MAEHMLTFAGGWWDALPVKKHRLPVKLMAALWLTTYVVCIGLVCSFILFEVLDIDGSDFPAPLSNLATPIKLAEPPHEIKRAFLSGSAQFWAVLPVVIVLAARSPCAHALAARSAWPSRAAHRAAARIAR